MKIISPEIGIKYHFLIVNPDTGQFVSFDAADEQKSYCSENGFDNNFISFGSFDDTLEHLYAHKAEVVNDDILTNQDLKNLAQYHLWREFLHCYKKKNQANRLCNRPDAHLLTKFILYTFGNTMVRNILQELFVIDHRYNKKFLSAKKLYAKMKPIIENACGFKLSYTEFSEFLKDTQTKKVKSIGKKIAILGYLIRYRHRLVKGIERKMPGWVDSENFDKMIEPYLHKIAKQKTKFSMPKKPVAKKLKKPAPKARKRIIKKKTTKETD